MALIVETGTGLPNADSYITLADARVYAANYGLALPADDAEAEIALREGCQYIELQESRYTGYRVSTSQALAWPRTDAVNGFGAQYPDNVVPIQLGRAQVAAAAEYGAGTDVRASTDGRAVASEAVSGAVSVSYFNNGQTGSAITITKAMDALKPLFSGDCGSPLTFSVLRA